MMPSGTEEGRPPLEELLERYLEGGLSAEEESALVEALRQSPERLDELAHLLRVDEGLKVLFSPGESPRSVARAVVERLKGAGRAGHVAAKVVDQIRFERGPGPLRSADGAGSHASRRYHPGARGFSLWSLTAVKCLYVPLAAVATLLLILVVALSGSPRPGVSSPDVAKEINRASEGGAEAGKPVDVPRPVPATPIRPEAAPSPDANPGPRELPPVPAGPRTERPPRPEKAPPESPPEKVSKPPAAEGSQKPSPDLPRESPRRETVPSEAVTVAAVLGRVEGDAQVVVGTQRTPAREGQAIPEGAAVETKGENSSATLSYPDGTWLEVGRDTKIEGLSAGPGPAKGEGKQLRLSQGTLTADIVPQPERQPMLILTPSAEATVLGTTLRMVVDPDPKKGSTLLRVTEGRVRLKPTSGTRTVDVMSGHFAVAAVGVHQIHVRPFEGIRLLWIDFEDARPPRMLYPGKVAVGPARGANRLCLEGTVPATSTDGVPYANFKLSRNLILQDQLVLRFRYFSEGHKLRVEVRNEAAGTNYRFYIMNVVKGRWAHAEVVVNDMWLQANDRKMRQGDALSYLSLGGLSTNDKGAVYFDDVEFVRVPATGR